MATKRTPSRPAGEQSHIRVVGAGERAPDPGVAALFRPDPGVAELFGSEHGVTEPPAEFQSGEPRAKTLAEAVAGGSYQEILQAQIRDIVEDLKSANGAAKAALHGRLMVISKEIETLKISTPGGAKSVVATSSDESWDSSAI